MRKVMILGLTKNEIIIKDKKQKSHKKLSFIISIFVIFSFIIIGLSNFNISSELVSVYNPVNSLYSDNSNIVFTNGTITNDKLEFTLPILSSKIENNNGTLEFVVGKSIMVKSIENGVVIDVGSSLDGIKYIKIKHSEDIYSVLENVDIIGVTKFDVIKKGQDIATSKEGNKVTLKIFNNDIQVTNIVVNQSKIICQN